MKGLNLSTFKMFKISIGNRKIMVDILKFMKRIWKEKYLTHAKNKVTVWMKRG